MRPLIAYRRAVTPLAWSTGVGGAISSEHNTGTIVTATNSDIVSEKMMTIDSCLKRMLEKPARKKSGTKTATCVSVEARMALQISSAPSMAACTRFLPISRWRCVFSSTTIEASTIMPTPSASPPKVIVFSV